MSWLAECDACGQSARPTSTVAGGPQNPITEGRQWYSRTPKETGETLHACSAACLEHLERLSGGGPPLLSGMQTDAGEKLRRILETPVQLGWINPRGVGPVPGRYVVTYPAGIEHSAARLRALLTKAGDEMATVEGG